MTDIVRESSLATVGVCVVAYFYVTYYVTKKSTTEAAQWRSQPFYNYGIFAIASAAAVSGAAWLDLWGAAFYFACFVAFFTFAMVFRLIVPAMPHETSVSESDLTVLELTPVTEKA